MNGTRRMIVAALALSPVLAALPASADAVISASLWDKPGMDMATGLGHGMGGDMSKANMGITLSKSEVAAGSVTLNATNDSKDMIHEMVVAPLTSPDEVLAYKADLDKVDEDAAVHLGEVAELEPGQKGALTINLKPGQYILYCNIPGHYMAGMWTVLTVK